MVQMNGKIVPFTREEVMKRWSALLATLVFVLPLTSCSPDGPPDPTLPALTVSGEDVVDEDGARVMLRGVNAGGLGVTEGWMCAVQTEENAPGGKVPAGDIRVRDFYSASKALIERFGFEEAKSLWETYRESWWSEEDFQNCSDMGINVIRLPFSYMNVDFDALKGEEYAGLSYDFSFLDGFVKGAAKYGIYTILDLHGAYGSQNGQDHSGQVFDSAKEVDFYTNEKNISLTEKLWGAVAEHFQGNTAVAGYDILNEPGEKRGETNEKHWQVFDRLYDAIRAKDEKHIVIFESCWDERVLPPPSYYKWENCMYSFHHYTGVDKSSDELFAGMQARVEGLKSAHFGVPIQMGEFTCYEFEDFWKATLSYFNKQSVHWVSWTYKVMPRPPKGTESNPDPVAYGTGWGIFNIKKTNSARADLHRDSYGQIEEKFRATATATDGEPFVFPSGTQLFDLVYRYATEEYERTFAGGVLYEHRELRRAGTDDHAQAQVHRTDSRRRDSRRGGYLQGDIL